MFKLTPQIIPSMDSYYRWSGWTSSAVSLNNIYLVDLNKDNKLDIVIAFWQMVQNNNSATNAPTPNRLVILESQVDGTYKDTTAVRFGTTSPVILGGELGGVGVADFGDINRDGTLDMLFALNRDDGRLGTQTSGDSYPTAIMSLPNGQYEIQKISSPVWSYFPQLIDLGNTTQAWISQIGYYTSSKTYGNGITGSVDGQTAYTYNTATNSWSGSGQPPVSGSFYVLPQQVSNGRVTQTLAMVWDSSTAFAPELALPGGSFRIPKPVLMQQTPAGDWVVQSTAKTYDYQPQQFTFNGNKQTGMVAYDGTNHFALIEYFYRPGNFNLFPGSDPVVMSTRSMTLLDKNVVSGQYTGTVNATKMDFFSVGASTVKQLPIKVVGEQLDLAAWSYRYLDFNKDGLTDIVVEGWHSNLGPQDPSSGAPAIYLSTGAGVFVHLAESLFPRAPEGWSRYSMSQVLDANGDGNFDLLYFPAIANGKFISNLDWLLYLGNEPTWGGAYTAPILITDRIHSPLIKTQAGNDLIKDANAASLTHIDTGLGVDTVQYAGLLANYQIKKIGNVWVVTTQAAGPSQDNLSQVERLQFADTFLAIDMSGNAGTTAKILGAVFGKTSVRNKEYVGIGLDLLDKGMSYEALAGLALSAAKATTNDQIVTSIWSNLFGSAPTLEEKTPYIKILEDGMTPGTLARIAAESSFNATNINLVGLAQTGIEYIPTY